MIKAGDSVDGAGASVQARNAVVVDLTQMFGAGNEPTTPAEFEAMFPNDFYAEAAATIISNKAASLVTEGFNLYNPETGTAWLPGVYADYEYLYEIVGTYTSLSFTDVDGNTTTITPTEGKFNVPKKGTLTVTGGDSTTLIHLVWSGWRNYGLDYQFESFWQNKLDIDITTLTGKLDGEGESVVIAPNGLWSVGSAFDYGVVEDGMLTKIVKVIDGKDMGTLTYTKASGNYFYAALSAAVKFTGNGVKQNLLSIGFDTIAQNDISEATTKVIAGYYTNSTNRLYAYDPDYVESDADAFKSAVSGKYVYYQVATPQTYILDEPIPVTYPVDDFGTERVEPEGVDTNGIPKTAPIRYDVVYALNAGDTIRRLPQNYISKESMEAFLTALGEQMNGTWTMAFNAETQKFGFTFTANQEGE